MHPYRYECYIMILESGTVHSNNIPQIMQPDLKAFEEVFRMELAATRKPRQAWADDYDPVNLNLNEEFWRLMDEFQIP